MKLSEIGFKHFTPKEWALALCVATFPVVLVSILAGVRPPGWILLTAFHAVIAFFGAFMIAWPDKAGIRHTGAGDSTG